MKRVSILTAAIVMFAASPSFAVEGSAPTVPIKVECHVGRSAAAAVSAGALTPGAGVTLTNGVTVKVTNVGTKTVKDATLYGTYAGQKITDTVNLEIAPGETVWFSRSYAQLPYEGPDVACHVKHVNFKDGTSYSEAK